MQYLAVADVCIPQCILNTPDWAVPIPSHSESRPLSMSSPLPLFPHGLAMGLTPFADGLTQARASSQSVDF